MTDQFRLTAQQASTDCQLQGRDCYEQSLSASGEDRIEIQANANHWYALGRHYAGVEPHPLRVQALAAALADREAK